jgi:hypothetical protein
VILGMRIGFHKLTPTRREVGSRPIRALCRPEPEARHFRQRLRIFQEPAVIVADLELGTHDTVFIRGAGGGLRWDKGQPLVCTGPKTWVWSPASAEEKLEFQLLLNDEVWARGEPVVLEAGASMEITPDFEWPDIPKTA